MSRTGLMTDAEWRVEGHRRMREGPCCWMFFDPSRRRVAVYDSQAEAEAAFPTLPHGNWEAAALHSDAVCQHPEWAAESARRPGRAGFAARVAETLEQIERNRRQSPN